jgi:hypothetical protein
MNVEAKKFKFVVGSSNAQSLPPSSMHVGIIDSAAAEATFLPTTSLPMTVCNRIAQHSVREQSKSPLLGTYK